MTEEPKEITVTKEEVIEALDGKHFLKKNVTGTLKALVCCSADNVVRSSVADLAKLAQINPKACYPAIKKLEKEGYIIVDKNQEIGLQLSKFLINPNKLKALVKDYRLFKFGETLMRESIENKLRNNEEKY